MNTSLELEERAKAIQEECHKTVEYIIKTMGRKQVTVQDATNVFLFSRIAELELMISPPKNEKRAIFNNQTNKKMNSYTEQEIIAATELEFEAWKSEGEKKRTNQDYIMLGFIYAVIDRLKHSIIRTDNKPSPAIKFIKANEVEPDPKLSGQPFHVLVAVRNVVTREIFAQTVAWAQWSKGKGWMFDGRRLENEDIEYLDPFTYQSSTYCDSNTDQT